MSNSPIVIASLLLFAATLFGPEVVAQGVLYGTVVKRPGGQPIPGLTVAVACPAFTVVGTSRPSAEPSSAVTDERGGFTLVARTDGRRRCQVRVEEGSRSSRPLEIFASDSSLKYDLEVDSNFDLSIR